MSEFLKSLKIDRWYKVVLYIGSFIFVLPLFFEVKTFSKENALLLGVSLFLIGLSEWKNEKKTVEFKPPNAYTGPAAILQYPVRKPDVIGVAFLITGIILFFIFLLKITSII